MSDNDSDNIIARKPAVISAADGVDGGRRTARTVVGAVLGAALQAAGHAVVGVHASSEQSRERAGALLPDVPVLDVPTIVERSELVLLAVPDDQLPGLVSGLGTTGAWQPALLAAGALGFGYILTQPTLVSLSMDADPTQTGLCTGLIGLGVFAGGGVGSALGSQLVALGGYDALWIAAGVLLVAQLVLGGRAFAALAHRVG